MMRYLILIILLSTNSAYAKQWSLDELLDYALENSPVIKKSQIDADISTMDVDLAKQDHNLGFTFNVESFSGFTFGRERLIIGGVVVSDDVTNNNDFVEPFLVLQFRYPLFKEGKFVFQKSLSEDIATVKKDNSISRLNLNKEDLIFSVANLYLELAQLSKKITYYQDSLNRLDKILEEAKARYDENIITKPEYTRAEHRKNNKELEIKIARIDLEVFQRQFLNLLGMPLNENILIVDYDLNTFDKVSVSVPGYDVLKHSALKDSPELLIAENELELSILQSKLAKKKILPDIYLRDTSVFTTNDNGHFVALGITFPLHNVFKRVVGDPELKKSILDIEKNKITLSQTKNEIELGLFQDYSNWKKATYSTETLMHNIKIEETKLEEAREKFANKHFSTGEYLKQLDSFEITRMEYNDQKKIEVNTLLVLLKNSGLIDEYVYPDNPINQ